MCGVNQGATPFSEQSALIRGLEWVTMRSMNGLDLIRHAGITLGVLSLVFAQGCKPAHEAEYPYGLRPVETELVEPTEEAPPPSMTELRALLEAQTDSVEGDPGASGSEPTVARAEPIQDTLSRDPEAPKPEPETSPAPNAAKRAVKASPTAEPRTEPVGEEPAESAPIVRPERRTFHDFRGEWIRGNNDVGQQAWRFGRSGFFDCREDHLDGVRLERTGTWRVQEAESKLMLSFNEWRHAPGADGKIVRKMSTGHTDSLSYAVEAGGLRIGGVALRSGPDDTLDAP